MEPKITSARVRSGHDAANRIAVGPPPTRPMIAARAEPAASITAIRSFTRGLEVGRLIDRERVRQAGAAAVEGDDAGEGTEPLIKPAGRRQLPQQLDVREESGHQHEVEVALAPHLERDVGVAVPGVHASPAPSAEAYGDHRPPMGEPSPGSRHRRVTGL